ncbi:hypothetical protein Moror_6697 [Moniliophthora roreri MCA 2997]|uniref:Uncharacterized protein n=1 Tax=Moniliophthora roreri (strain MCA 2997) TaxID=1381753 RepID=V2XSL2_MONRO|nr:hypothetical protein Moror_6697 [Moniliophthora roreri MCA 2997]
MLVQMPPSTTMSRRNWNIPKHRANLDFKKNSLITTISVSDPEGDGTPFSSAKDLPTAAQIPLELNTTFLADYTTPLQPPFPGDPSNPALVATATWKETKVTAN